ncbi:MAG: sugar ABC transporter substrate-binding protein, partial [Oscillospiraceae bacterium]
MKKIIVLLIALLISLLSFSGCKTPSESKKQPAQTKTITLWHYYNGGIKAQFDELVQTFNETVGKEKGIIVDAYSQGGVNELA